MDEFQHKYENYIQRCELIRVSRIVEGFGGIPVHIIHYNPDAFKINGVTRRTTLLRTQLWQALAQPDFEHRIVVQYLWLIRRGLSLFRPIALLLWSSMRSGWSLFLQWFEHAIFFSD